MIIPIKAKLPKNNVSFISWEIKVKVKSISDLEKSIDYNWGYILLSVKKNIQDWDEWYYLQINDYYK